ncbi:Fe-S cluster assembly protein SufD [Teredinibacter franksiae]|uniref:Fe-S cluster assembly protein SufD n=1 Tax=Teredinibacter franksiae TaxID=2761453 RepID=UPI0016291D09|nr:Fe-S cluster assembly protein SufD [Teredinibacter franksiae]
MSGFIQQAAKPFGSPLDWLAGFNREGLFSWQSHALPDRKIENWKYTNLRALEQGDYLRFGQPLDIDGSQIDSLSIPDLHAYELVFINGYYSEALSSDISLLPKGVELVRFSTASKDQQLAIQRSLDSLTDTQKHMFAALNAAQLGDGVFLHVSKNVHFEKPVHIVYSNTQQSEGYSLNPRVLVQLESGSEATVIEHFARGDNEQNTFANSVTELLVGENARLNHYRLLLEHESAIHIGSVNVGLQRNATLNSFTLGVGGKIKRTDMIVHHQGEGAHCEINGVYLTRNSQHIDYHTCIEHAVPHCTSNEVFRGIIADSSRAVFNGRIHIHPHAQKTFAQLSNKNLLTSNKAEVDTKPELEIYADDVQCAHGATVAQLNDEAMHYLRTRGVSEAEARVMLSFGFINELINDIKLKPVAAYLRPLLAEMFSSEEKLTRHIV